MTHIELDYSKALKFVDEHELTQQQEIVKTIHRVIHEGTGAGNDFLGWLDLPVDYDKEEFSQYLNQVINDAVREFNNRNNGQLN